VKISGTMVGNGLLPAGNRKGRPAIKQTPQLRCALWGSTGKAANELCTVLIRAECKEFKTSCGHFTFYPTHEDFHYYSNFQPFKEVVIDVASPKRIYESFARNELK